MYQKKAINHIFIKLLLEEFKSMKRIIDLIKQKFRKKLFKIIKPELNRKISEIYQIIPQLIDYKNAPPRRNSHITKRKNFIIILTSIS